METMVLGEQCVCVCVFSYLHSQELCSVKLIKISFCCLCGFILFIWGEKEREIVSVLLRERKMEGGKILRIKEYLCISYRLGKEVRG